MKESLFRRQEKKSVVRTVCLSAGKGGVDILMTASPGLCSWSLSMFAEKAMPDGSFDWLIVRGVLMRASAERTPDVLDGF